MKKDTGRLCLHVPRLDELWYRQKLMSDPDTMSYNKGYDLDFEGYHKDTGCIDFPEREWADWHDYFVGREPERWYAYIVRREDGVFLGEVNVHRSVDGNRYDMGVVVEAKYRGEGYGAEGLALLMDYAFRVLGVPALHNDFEEERTAALRIHLAAGFVETGRASGIMELTLTKEAYQERKGL